MLDLLMARRGAPRPGDFSTGRALERFDRRGGVAIALCLAVVLLAVLPVAAFGLAGARARLPRPDAPLRRLHPARDAWL